MPYPAATTPNFLLGKDLTGVTITGYVDNAGTLVVGATRTVTTEIDAFSPRLVREKTQVRAVNDVRLNSMTIAAGYAGTLRLIATRANHSAVVAILRASTHILVEAVVAGDLHACMFSLGDGAEWGVAAADKNPITIPLDPVSLTFDPYQINGA